MSQLEVAPPKVVLNSQRLMAHRKSIPLEFLPTHRQLADRKKYLTRKQKGGEQVCDIIYIIRDIIYFIL